MNKQENSARLNTELDEAHRLLHSGRRRDALAILRPMLEMQATGSFWGNVALLLMQTGDLDSALVAARKFVAACPDAVEATSLLANVLADLGRLDESIALASRVCK